MTKNKEIFAEWLALPKKMREPKTQKELAVLLDVQPETMSRWKKTPGFNDLVYEISKQRLESELPEIMHVIAEKAKEGDIKFVKLVLELTGRHTDAITVRSEAPQIGIEQYSAVIKQVSEWEKERFENGN